MNTAIYTYTGKMFDPFNPRPEDICIEDIAHGLSYQTRFNGQAPYHYSIALHSMLMAVWLWRNIEVPRIESAHQHDNARSAALGAMLHDASEAYLSDIPAPYKAHIAGYGALESTVTTHIFDALRVEVDTTYVDVVAADKAIVNDEAIELWGSVGLKPEWAKPSGRDWGPLLQGYIDQHSGELMFKDLFNSFHEGKGLPAWWGEMEKGLVLQRQQAIAAANDYKHHMH